MSAKVESRKQFNEVLRNVEEQVKHLMANKERASVNELREYNKTLNDTLKKAKDLFNDKGKRKVSNGSTKPESSNRGLCQPIVVHQDVRDFVFKAPKLGTSHPYDYEFSSTEAGFSDPLQGGKHFDVKCTDADGNEWYGPACYGRARSVKPGSNNVKLSEIFKSLQKNGITSSAQLNSMFSVYMIENGLKKDGHYSVDAHMEKYFGSALTNIEKGGNFDRHKFKPCALMKIIAYYTKKNLESQPESKIAEWASKCGMTVPAFTKSHSMTAAEKAAFYGDNGKVRPEVVRAIDEETSAISSTVKEYRAHNTVVVPKKARTVAPKASKAPILAAKVEESSKAEAPVSIPAKVEVTKTETTAVKAEVVKSDGAKTEAPKPRGRAPATKEASTTTESTKTVALKSAPAKVEPKTVAKAVVSKVAPAVSGPSPSSSPPAAETKKVVPVVTKAAPKKK